MLARPEVYEEYLCFHAIAKASGDWEAVDRRLAELSPRLPFPGWALLLRGHLAQLHDEARSIARYREAVAAFAANGGARGEILARHNLRNLHHRRGESAAAAAEVESALAAAERSGEPALRAQALVLRGTHLVETGGDLAEAHYDLRRALDLLPDDASYPQRKLALLALANAAFQLARYDESVATYERLLALARAQGDKVDVATALFNIANARQRQFEDQPRPASLAELERLAAAALAAAREASNRPVEIRSAALLAQVELAQGRTAEARQRLESALALAREVGHPERIMICLWTLADLLEADDPAAARARVEEATALALSTGNDRHLVHAWRARMRLDWRTQPRAAALASAKRGLGAIEELAALQGDEAATVGLFGAWSRDYRWLAGQLLEGDEPDVATAFAVMERMRARALLAAIDAAASPGTSHAGLSAEPAGTPDAGSEPALRLELARLQRQLLDPALQPERFAALARELDQREIELAAARARDARFGRATGARFGYVAGADPLAFARLDELQSALRAGEALLLFQLAPRRDLYDEAAGGSWLLTVTASGVHARPLPDPAAIEPLVALFLGLVERRDGSEREAAVRLRQLLLDPALESAAEPVERLLIVPDGALFRLPFELLRTGPEQGSAPVGARYELAVEPSATALLRFRAGDWAPAQRSALILADPQLAYGAPDGIERSATTAGGAAIPSLAGLAPLAGARREGRWVERTLRPTSELFAGATATEGVLDRIDLATFAVLHVAAHAVAETVQPQRSAIFLATENEDDDGLLQAAEIARLPLGGRLVVLSACRSAAGATGEGEGPLSLARAFQQAGARAVVASRWPLRDDEAEQVVRLLYRHLVAGASLGSAMRELRAEAAADLPAAAWGAFVLMGEPEFAPLAGVRITRFDWRALLLAVLALGAVTIVVVRAMRRPRA